MTSCVSISSYRAAKARLLTLEYERLAATQQLDETLQTDTTQTQW